MKIGHSDFSPTKESLYWDSLVPLVIGETLSEEDETMKVYYDIKISNKIIVSL